MAFTQITVEASYAIDGEPASGTVTFTLTQPLANSGVLLPCSPLVVELDDTGAISVELAATDDLNTQPQGVWYGVTEQIIGAQPRDYFIEVSTAGPSPLTLTPPSTLPWQ